MIVKILVRTFLWFTKAYEIKVFGFEQADCNDHTGRLGQCPGLHTEYYRCNIFKEDLSNEDNIAIRCDKCLEAQNRQEHQP